MSLIPSSLMSPLFVAQGSRNDIKSKRTPNESMPMCNSGHTAHFIRNSQSFNWNVVLYSANIPPPSWIRIFQSSRPISRQTQATATAIAYMFPDHYEGIDTRVHLRTTTAYNRCHKSDSQLMNICIPPEFVTAAATHMVLLFDKIVIVCDGDTDHHSIPASPPHPIRHFIAHSISCRQKSLRGNLC